MASAQLPAEVKIGVDIGGTFTDVVSVVDGKMFFLKVASTPGELGRAVVECVRRVLDRGGREPSMISRLSHGTTAALNAIIQKKGVRIGLLTTKGFVDLLSIGRQGRPDIFDLFFESECPEFVAPRYLRAGITERMDSEGKILVPLVEQDVHSETARLVNEFGVAAIAICYLFSFRNPVHELRTFEIIRQQFPGLPVYLSSQIAPVIREYERLCLTVFSAYIGPVMNKYLQDLESELSSLGVKRGVLKILQARGAVMSSEVALEKPVNTIMSGPAGGVTGASFVGLSAGVKDEQGKEITDFVGMDLGGTSCDISFVMNGKVELTATHKLDDIYPIATPCVDLVSFGAGGGSIAWIDEAGLLRVGPQSAGADPGPICYKRGGRQVTVTDAALVLGFLNPRRFAGGEIKLAADEVTKAIGELGKQIGLDAISTAHAIHHIVNTRMSDQLTLHAMKRGIDIRIVALVLFGGAGPMHGGAVLGATPLRCALVPLIPGLLSAFGALIAPVTHEAARSFVLNSADPSTPERVRAIFDELSQRSRQLMERENVIPSEISTYRSADMRYEGQSYEIEIPLDINVDSRAILQAVQDFGTKHEAMYGHQRAGVSVEFVTFRNVNSVASPVPDISIGAPGQSLQHAFTETRRVYFGKYLETPVYDRFKLPHGGHIKGPAILEQDDCTTIVYPGQYGVVLESGNFAMYKEA